MSDDSPPLRSIALLRVKHDIEPDFIVQPRSLRIRQYDLDFRDMLLEVSSGPGDGASGTYSCSAITLCNETR